MADDDILTTASTFEGIAQRTKGLEASANGFARAMTRAFASSITGGKQFDDVLKSLTLRISDMAVKMAFKPLEKMLSGGIASLFSAFSGGGGLDIQKNAIGAVKPFAAGGVIGTPTYFPMMGGGVGLAGEAGPEAIMPLRRGADGRLGVASDGGGASPVTIHIATNDAESFRRSESYVAGQIARAVARGRRTM